MAGLTAPADGAPAVLLLAETAGSAVADRLLSGAADVGLRLERPAPIARELGEALRATYAAGRPCICIGPIDRLVLALAPLLAERAGAAATPLVRLSRDGGQILPMLGLGRGAEALATQVAAALASAPASARPAQAVPGPGSRGRLAVVGLGPGAADLMAPAVQRELQAAQDIVGYTTYVRMAGPFRPDQRILDSDNRHELDRARLAFQLAAQGRHVVVVSSGDPGVFAMAAAVMEALEQADDPAWGEVELEILPGISAAQAVAARAGAPLGHDFCVISLSDNLKPWSQIALRLEHAALADLVIALYNPCSVARPRQLGEALDLLRRYRDPATTLVLGRDVARPGETLTLTSLGEVRPDQVDMRTLVILGSSQTRQIPRAGGGAWVYTPRWYPDLAGRSEP